MTKAKAAPNPSRPVARDAKASAGRHDETPADTIAMAKEHLAELRSNIDETQTLRAKSRDAIQELRQTVADTEHSAGPKKAAKDKGVLSQAEKTAKAAENLQKYEALAREHGADLSEEGFNEALRRVGKPR